MLPFPQNLSIRRPVAQEFGDHPESAVARMRWARAVTSDALPEPMIVTAMLLGAIAREALGSSHAARRALEHALGLAEADQVPFPRGPRPRESLTHGEARVLRYLPTHLSTREIAAELYLSANTVKTHQRHLYAKLGAHSRTQAVERARALGLLTSPAAYVANPAM